MADYEEGFRTAVGCSLEPMGAGSLWLIASRNGSYEPLYVYSDRACFEITENRNPRGKSRGMTRSEDAGQKGESSRPSHYSYINGSGLPDDIKKPRKSACSSGETNRLI